MDSDALVGGLHTVPAFRQIVGRRHGECVWVVQFNDQFEGLHGVWGYNGNPLEGRDSTAVGKRVQQRK